jgi:ABC-type uncharacterized transport system substrate-binding protein
MNARTGMRSRRKFLGALGAATLAAPLGALAQGPGSHRIAVLLGGSQSASAGFYDAFLKGLAAYGYAVGTGLTVDARFGAAPLARAQELAEELLAQKPAVLVAAQGAAIVAATALASSPPLVIIPSGNPVDAGWVKSFAHPGGNVTGISLMAVDLVGKRIELLKEAMPGLRRIAVITDPQHPGQHRERNASEEAAGRLGLQVLYHPTRNAAELDAALHAAKAAGAEAIVAFPDAVTAANAANIAAFSIHNRIPVVAGWASFVEAGCMLSYGPNQHASYARAAYFVDRILRGANPADLPIELPSVVELAVNRKSARALGVTIPQSILVRADRVVG